MNVILLMLYEVFKKRETNRFFVHYECWQHCSGYDPINILSEYAVKRTFFMNLHLPAVPRKGSHQLIVTLYTLSIYPFVHNQLISFRGAA